MAELVIKLVNGELAGKTTQEINKNVTAAALALKKAEIGTEAWVKANQKLDAAKKLQEDLKKQIEGTTAASEMLKKAWNTLPGAQYFNQIADSFGMFRKGVGGLTTQFGALKVAIASTGLGLLILLLASLISYFTSTQEGIDKVTSVTRPLAAIFERLKGVLQELGGKVFKQIEAAIKNPIQAFKDLGQIILDNVLNRFKALTLFGPAIKKILSGDIKDGLKDLGNAAIQMGTGVTNVIDRIGSAAKATASFVSAAWKEGQRLDQLQKQIERDEIRQITRMKELELLIKQQKAIVEDTTKSWDERRAAAELAMKAQQQQLGIELSLLDKRIEKMKLEQSLNDTSRENEKELAELIAKKSEVQARVTEQGIEFAKKLTEFDIAQAAEREAARKAELAIEQNIQDLKDALIEDAQQREIEQIWTQSQRKIEALIGTEEQIRIQKALLQEQEILAVQAVVDKYAAEAKAKKDAQLAEDLRRQERHDEAVKQMLSDRADFEAHLTSAQEDLAKDAFDFSVDLLSKTVQNERAAKIIRKSAALIEIGIALQREKAQNAILAGQFAATIPPPGNIPAFLGALVKLNTVSNIRAAIGAARVLAFKKGGVTPNPQGMVLQGPSHSNGGINVNAEGEEIIMTKGVYRNPVLRAAASRINELGGGIRFAALGGPVNPFVSNGSVASGGSSSAAIPGQNDVEIQKLNANFLTFAEEIRTWKRDLKVYNNPLETQRSIDEIKQIENDANV